ncbi:hypothetical protein [Pseudomonas sp. S2_H08]
MTLVGCALPGISAAAGAASFLESWEATGKLFAPYEYTQGDRVLASFSSETYPGDVNPLRDYGTEAAKAAVEMVLLKGAGKYLEGTGSSILVSGVKKEGVVADGVIGASNTDKPVLPAWYREDSSAGASFNKTDGLPDGYRRVLNTRTGNAEVLAPDGQLYFDTGNGLKPKVGGNLAELAEAERQIAAAKGSSGAGSADEFIPEGMDRPFRSVNPDHPPSKSVVDAMNSTQINNMVKCSSADCSDIANKLFSASGGKGKIIEVVPSSKGALNVFENGSVVPEQWYHQVYTDGRYVYDPRLSSSPIPKGDWEQHIKKINPGGVTISDKLKGLR